MNGRAPLKGARYRFQECIVSVTGGQFREGGCVGRLRGHGVDKGEVVNLKSIPQVTVDVSVDAQLKAENPYKDRNIYLFTRQ